MTDLSMLFAEKKLTAGQPANEYQSELRQTQPVATGISPAG